MDNKQKIRDWMISYLKRYIYEMRFLSKVVDQNRGAFDNSADDAINQFETVVRDMEYILEYNFYEEEIDAVDPAGLGPGEEE